MRITRWAEFGILCAMYIANKSENGPVSATVISESEKIPLQYTHQILQRLRKGGIITSVRGPSGGYSLARSPAEITLHEILMAVEGRTFEVICDYNPVDPHRRCADSKECLLNHVWTEIQQTVDSLLQRKTLAELIRDESRGELVKLGNF